MSHYNQVQFINSISEVLKQDIKKLKIVEIGSHSVNGEIRDIFNGAISYTGIDLKVGPGVDLVASGHDYGETGSSDLTISCEVLEHNPFWIETVFNMVRITKPGGLVVITCASTGRREHGTSRTNPNDSPGTSFQGWSYYRNVSTKEFLANIKPEKHFINYLIFYIDSSSDLYFVGEKKNTPTEQIESGLKGWLGKNVQKIEKIVGDINKNSKIGFRTAVIYFPVKILSKILSDENYQHFALIHYKMVERLLQILKK